jgi:hypothetical protein
MMMSSRRFAPRFFGGGAAQLAAPPALSLMSFVLMLAVIIIPPGLYQSIMLEDDMMYLNPCVVGIFTAYWLVFLAGYFAASKLRVAYHAKSFNLRRYISVGGLAVAGLIALEILCFAYSFHVIYRRVPDIFYNFATGNMQRTKREIMQGGTSGSFSIIVPISTGTFWWILFRWDAICRSVSALFKNAVLWPLTLLFAATAFTYYTLLGSRYEIVPLLFGLMIAFYVKKKLENAPFTLPERMLLLFFPAFLFFIFIGFALLRGASGFDGLLNNLMGYGPASYNRLAAILNGTLNYDDQYGILNETAFLFHFPFEQRVLPIDAVFNLPRDNEISIYSQQVAYAHLVKGYMWSSLFGQIYTDMGLFSFLYMFIYGAAAGILWKLFTRKRVFGILVYPWLAFSVFMWFGYDCFTAQDLSALIVMSVVFVVFEKYCARA